MTERTVERRVVVGVNGSRGRGGFRGMMLARSACSACCTPTAR